MITNEMKKKAEFYLEKKVKVHIETKSGRFYNGLILELHFDHLILIDKVLGEIIINCSEITVFEKYREVRK